MINIITKRIKSITTKDNIVCIELKLNKNISFNLNQIKYIYIKKQPVNVFYFMGIGIALLMLLVSYFNLPVKTYIIVIIIDCILYLFIKNTQYSLFLIGNDDEEHIFSFHKNFKFEVLKQIKIIRGIIQDELFHDIRKNL
jgi:hypothetical protein